MYRQGSGQFTYTDYFQVNKKKNGLQKIDNGLGKGWTPQEDIVNNIETVYYDARTNAYHYLTSDYVHVSAGEYGYYVTALSLRDNKLERTYLGSRYMGPNKDGTKAVYKYYKNNIKTGKEEKISENEFSKDLLADEAFKKCGKMTTGIEWFQFEKKIKQIPAEHILYYLRKSYQAFSLGDPLVQKEKTICGFKVNVPQYTNMSDTKKQKQLNRLIVSAVKENFEKVFDLKSDATFLEKNPFYLDADTFRCQIKQNTQERVSLLVEAEGYGKGAAHPMAWAYAVNIDRRNVTMLSQTDILPEKEREKIASDIMEGSCIDVREVGYRKMQKEHHDGKLLEDESYWADVEVYQKEDGYIGIVIPTSYALGSYQIYEVWTQDGCAYEDIDWFAYQYKMPEDKYAILQNYAPVLLNKSMFRLSIKEKETKEVTISQFLTDWKKETGKETVDFICVSFCDINGDKEKEVAIDFFTDFYATLILAKNESGYYGYFSDRMLETENGIFSSFEGDDETDICDVYYRLTFQNGKWYMTELARDGELYIGEKSKSYYRLNGKDVTEDEYDEWLGKEWEDVPKHYEPISKERTAY